MTTLNANSNPAYVALQAFLGVADESHDTAIDFETNSNFTGAAIAKQVISVPGSTSSESVSISTLFPNCPSPQFFAVYDLTPSPGQPFGVSLDGTNFAHVAAGSFFSYVCDGTALPSTIYLKNANTAASTIAIVCITN